MVGSPVFMRMTVFVLIKLAMCLTLGTAAVAAGTGNNSQGKCDLTKMVRYNGNRTQLGLCDADFGVYLECIASQVNCTDAHVSILGDVCTHLKVEDCEEDVSAIACGLCGSVVPSTLFVHMICPQSCGTCGTSMMRSSLQSLASKCALTENVCLLQRKNQRAAFMAPTNESLEDRSFYRHHRAWGPRWWRRYHQKPYYTATTAHITQTTTITTTTSSTLVPAAPCNLATLPSVEGSEVADCLNLSLGDNCTASCEEGFTGEPGSFTCDQDGNFVGSPPTCELSFCSTPEALDALSLLHDCDGTPSGSSCSVACADGYNGTPAVWNCTTGALGGVVLSGTVPECTANICTDNLPMGFGIDSTACENATVGESCFATCGEGLLASGSSEATCTSSGSFTNISLQCSLPSCGNLSALSAFAQPYLEHDCTNQTEGAMCAAECIPGYAGEGVVLVCNVGPTTADSEGYAVVDSSGNLTPANLPNMAPACVAEVVYCTFLPDVLGRLLSDWQ